MLTVIAETYVHGSDGDAVIVTDGKQYLVGWGIDVNAETLNEAEATCNYATYRYTNKEAAMKYFKERFTGAQVPESDEQYDKADTSDEFEAMVKEMGFNSVEHFTKVTGVEELDLIGRYFQLIDNHVYLRE